MKKNMRNVRYVTFSAIKSKLLYKRLNTGRIREQFLHDRRRQISIRPECEHPSKQNALSRQERRKLGLEPRVGGNALIIQVILVGISQQRTWRIAQSIRKNTQSVGARQRTTLGQNYNISVL